LNPGFGKGIYRIFLEHSCPIESCNNTCTLYAFKATTSPLTSTSAPITNTAVVPPMDPDVPAINIMMRPGEEKFLKVPVLNPCATFTVAVNPSRAPGPGTLDAYISTYTSTPTRLSLSHYMRPVFGLNGAIANDTRHQRSPDTNGTSRGRWRYERNNVTVAFNDEVTFPTYVGIGFKCGDSALS